MKQVSLKTQSPKSYRRKNSLNRAISIKEIESIINSFQKAPGPDGFSGEFYHTFKKELTSFFYSHI